MLVAAVFLAASYSKARQPAGFIETIRSIGIKSRPTSVLAWLVIIYEGIIGFGSALGIIPVIIASATLALLLVFLGVSIYVIVSNKHIPCNCFGKGTSTLGLQTVKHALILMIPTGAYFLSTFFVNSVWWPNTFAIAISSLSLVVAFVLIGRWVLISEELIALIGERRTT